MNETDKYPSRDA